MVIYYLLTSDQYRKDMQPPKMIKKTISQGSKYTHVTETFDEEGKRICVVDGSHHLSQWVSTGAATWWWIGHRQWLIFTVNTM